MEMSGQLHVPAALTLITYNGTHKGLQIGLDILWEKKNILLLQDFGKSWQMKVEMNVKLHVEVRYEIHTLANLTRLYIGEGWVDCWNGLGVVVKKTVYDTYANRKALGGWFFLPVSVFRF
jgi:hypothetical protein